MLKINKKKIFSILGGAAIGLSVVAAFLPGITYKYNYNRYVETNEDKVIEISNASYNPTTPIVTASDITASPRASVLPPSISGDGSAYHVRNNYSINEPRPNDSIYYGETYKIDVEGSPRPYGSILAVQPYNHFLKDPAKNNGVGFNFFGAETNLYTYGMKSSTSNGSTVYDAYFRYPSGFLTYPIIPESATSYQFNENTNFGFMFRNVPYDKNFTNGVTNPNEGFEWLGGGIYKPYLGTYPGETFKRYSQIYEKNNDVDFALSGGQYSFTGAMTFDIQGNRLSEFSNSPRKSAWLYVNQTIGAGIKDNFSFTPIEWYFTDHTIKNQQNPNANTTIIKAEEGSNYLKNFEFEFVNYIPKADASGQSNDLDDDGIANNATAKQIHSVSMTIGLSTTNRSASFESEHGYARPSIDYYAVADPTNLVTSLKNDNASLFKQPVIAPVESTGVKTMRNYLGSVPEDSKRNVPFGGGWKTYWGSHHLASVTISLTPVMYQDKYVYIPLVYSGTTKANIKAEVEPNDKNVTPLEYVTKGLYGVGTDNGIDGPDKKADFQVHLINGYPGNEFGARNTLRLNNVRGTIEWEYNPGTVLRNGVIKTPTDLDIKKVTIGGFKRIPGVTKIRDKIDTQSPFTLAQSIVADEFKLYKLIYDLGITNLPDVVSNTPFVDWTPDTIQNLKKIMSVDNVVFSNIGKKEANGYPEGGYIEADVSLFLYYNKDTNLIQPSMNKPRPPQKIRLYGFQHVEPTLVPQEEIYFGDPKMTANQAVEPNNIDMLKQYIVAGMETKIVPTFENDFRTTKGGTIPINQDFQDFSKIIQYLSPPVANNLEGTVSVNVSLAAYYANNEEGTYMTSGFKAIPIVISGFKKVQETKINSSITVSTQRTASEAVESNFTGADGVQQYPYIQYLLAKYKNDAFVGLPEGFNAGVIQLDQPQVDNIRGTVTVQVSVLMYYDKSGNLIDLTKNLPENEGRGPKPLGNIIIGGFKKVEPTALKQATVSVTGNLEFYNTLASQVDETKIASLIYQMKDQIFTSYPGLRFSINSIKITKVTPNNLNGTLTVEFALTRYYNNKGEYVEVDTTSDAWLKFNGPNSLNIIGFTSVRPTQFNKTEFDQTFKPSITIDSIQSKTTSLTTMDAFKAFMESKNSTAGKIFGGADTATPYEVTKIKSGPAGKEKYTISLKGPERSAWEILQLANKTIFQVSPEDMANYILRVLQYAGMQNYGINIKLSDIGIRFVSDRQQNAIVNTSNTAEFNDKNWYKGLLSVEVSIQLADGVWTKVINFNGKESKSENIFNRYVPLPILVSGSGEKNLSNVFEAGQIEHFIFQNIDEIINGSFSSAIPSGKPVNFSNFNVNISNMFYNNNQGTVSVLLTIDNFYLPSGNLSTDPSKEEAATAPKTISTTIVFKGFKQQKATGFAPQISLTEANAVIPFEIPREGTGLGNVQSWGEITAEKFWESLKSEKGAQYGGATQLVYDLIMGTGKVLPPTGTGASAIPNKNRILLGSAEIPQDFSVDNVIAAEATFSNVDGRLDIVFKIVNYYDLFGNLELTAPKTAKVSIYGFKTTLSSTLANSKFDEKSILSHRLVINGAYNTTASLATTDYIINNILSKTSGAWPSDLGEDTNTFDFVSCIKPNSIKIVSTNNSNGSVIINFFLEKPVKIYDENGNPRTLEEGVYTFEIYGFESTLLVYIGLSVLIVFALFIVLPIVIILVKKARVKSASRGKFSDFK